MRKEDDSGGNGYNPLGVAGLRSCAGVQHGGRGLKPTPAPAPGAGWWPTEASNLHPTAVGAPQLTYAAGRAGGRDLVTALIPEVRQLSGAHGAPEEIQTHDEVIAAYRASIWSLANALSERYGEKVGMINLPSWTM